MATSEQTIILAQGEDLEPLCLEAFLHRLRTDGCVEIRMQGGKVPTACELALLVLRNFATVTVTDKQIEEMNRLFHEALV